MRNFVMGAVAFLAMAAAAFGAERKQLPKQLPAELALDLGKGVKLELVLIPAGEFRMGSPDADGTANWDERPQHPVRIAKPFYLGKYPVTQEQWEAVMGENPSSVKGPKNPVERVSWDDCQTLLQRLNAKFAGTAGTFRLPTEAQWEYACRATSTTSWNPLSWGIEPTRYFFGDDEKDLGQYAWYVDNSGNMPHPVGQKKPNAWGLYDMHGNVWEWCQDWYNASSYDAKPVAEAGPATGSLRVVRGGGWDAPAWNCRSASRANFKPGDRDGDLGLRVLLVPAE